MVMAASPTKGNPMIEYFGLFSKVMTFAPKRIAVHSDSMMIVIGLQGLSILSAKRFCWTNAAVLDTVRCANIAIGASSLGDRKITKCPDAVSSHGYA